MHGVRQDAPSQRQDRVRSRPVRPPGAFDGGVSITFSSADKHGVARGSVVPGQRLREEPGIRFGIANGLLPVVLLVPWAVGSGVVPTEVVLVMVAGVACARLPRTVAALTGVAGWAWATGFTENEYGVLTFAPSDLIRLGAAVVGAALVAVACRRILVLIAAHWSRGWSAPSR